MLLWPNLYSCSGIRLDKLRITTKPPPTVRSFVRPTPRNTNWISGHLDLWVYDFIIFFLPSNNATSPRLTSISVLTETPTGVSQHLVSWAHCCHTHVTIYTNAHLHFLSFLNVSTSDCRYLFPLDSPVCHFVLSYVWPVIFMRNDVRPHLSTILCWTSFRIFRIHGSLYRQVVLWGSARHAFAKEDKAFSCHL
jgi:hypothetical protein